LKAKVNFIFSLESIFSRIMLFLLFTAYPCLASAHIGLWDKAFGDINANQSFNGYYAAELAISQQRNVHVSDLGIDFFDVGADSMAVLGLRIYDAQSKTLLLKVDTTIRGVHNSQVFIKFSFLFLKSRKYSVVVFSGGLNADNTVSLFQPFDLPFSESLNCFTLIGACFSDKDEFPTVEYAQIPVLNFGVDNQTGIDLFNEQQAKAHLFSAKNLRHGVEIQMGSSANSIRVDSVGVNYFDVGSDDKSLIQISIYDAANGVLLARKDTLLQKIHRTIFKIPLTFQLNAQNRYRIELASLGSFSDDDALYRFVPKKIPYQDNLNLMTIANFYSLTADSSTSILDSSGISFSLEFEEVFLASQIQHQSNALSSEVRVFPIPVNNYFVVDFREFVKPESLSFQLYALDGLRYDINFDYYNYQAVCSSSEIPQGLYFLKINCGNKQYFDKLVIRK
jgi:hypothetical protein